jgi:Winged helix DNA-binding domain
LAAALQTLSLRELNRATLARQLLLRRVRLSAPRAIERVAGLQAQWPPAPYVGLWSRVEAFRRASLARALARGDVVKATLMRATLHLVSARDYPVFLAGLHGGGASPLRAEALALGERASAGVRELFAAGPRSRSEVMEWLAEEHPHELIDRFPWTTWFAVCVTSNLVHTPEAAAWDARSGRRLRALDGAPTVDPAAARVEVVRRHLAAFGPASVADISQWSGMRTRDIRPALEALEPLRRFTDEEGRELLDLPRAPLPGRDALAPVRFLPKWDNLLLAHDDRRRVLPDEYRRVVIRKNGDVDQTFLVDGVVAGTWALVDGRVRVSPFAALPRVVRRDVEDEARRLEAFVA